MPKPLQITSGNYDEGQIIWSRNGSRIYFTTRRIDEPYYELPSTDIYSMPAAGGTPEKLTTVPTYVGDLALSPDGKQFAFHGSVTQPVRSYSQPDLWVVDVAPDAKPKNLTVDYDFDPFTGLPMATGSTTSSRTTGGPPSYASTRVAVPLPNSLTATRP